MNGLDDLRGALPERAIKAGKTQFNLTLAWTLRGAIQSHIDVYLSSQTFEDVKRTFPYMVAKEKASGGGDVCICIV